MINKRVVLLLSLVLIFGFFMVYNVHYSYTGLIQDPHFNPAYIFVQNFNYPYPIHADEWVHLARITQFLDEGKIFKNPYNGIVDSSWNYEVGYHLSLALFFFISRINPLWFYQFLPAIFFVLNSILLFYFVKHFTRKVSVALLSIFFFLAIPSNTNFLGNWFATPLTFSIFAIYLFFILFDKLSNWKYFLWLGLVYLFLLITYPYAAILVTFTSLVYLFLDKKKFEFINRLYLGFFILVLGILVSPLIFRKFIFTLDWTHFVLNYSLVFFYGLIPTLLALLGGFFWVKEKKNWIFIIWPSLCFLNLILYKLFSFGFFIAYERTFFYFFLGLCPLAAYGLYFLVNLIYKKNKSFFGIFLIFLLLFFTFYLVFHDYYIIHDENLVLLHLLRNSEYNSLKFIEENYGEGNVILADSLVSIGVYPISKNRVVAIQPSNLGAGDYQSYNRFVSLNCAGKSEFVSKENVDFVLSGFAFNCSGFRKVYSDGDFVYEV